MKRDITHLAKYHFVLTSQLQKLSKQIAISQKKLEHEQRKYAMLQECLLETRSHCQEQAENCITSIQFQQFQHFILQLEKALQLQNDTLINSQKNLNKIILSYQELKLKSNNLEELMAKTQQANDYDDNRKENQANTELYNRLKRFE